MQLTITPLYAALCGFILLFVSLRIPPMRRKLSVGLGSGSHAALERAIRVQGNFIEYVPLALILLALSEAGGAAPMSVHIVGGALVAGRVLHAYGLGRSAGVSPGRFIGTALTWLVILALSVDNLLRFFS